MMSRCRTAAVLLLLGAVLLPGAAEAAVPPGQPTRAAAEPFPLDPPGSTPRDEAEPGQLTFGVQPSGPESPDRRAAYTYDVAAGTSFLDYFAISNFSTSPVQLDVYGNDAVNTTEGGFDLLPADQEPTDAGSWIRLDQRTVEVPGRSRVVVPFRVEVPENASAGDHAGGVVASLPSTQTDAAGNRVRVDQRVGARLYVRVDGPLDPALSVEALTASYDGRVNPLGRGSTTISYQVRNTGNVRLSATQAVELDPLAGGRRAVPVESDIAELLPGGALSVEITVDGMLPAGPVNARVTLDPLPTSGPLDGAPLLGVRESTTFWAVPWALLLVLAAAAGPLGWRHSRRRRLPVARHAASRSRPGSPHPSRETVTLGSGMTSVALLVAALLLPAGPASAQAAEDGPLLANLTFSPTTGDQSSVIDLGSPVSCPTRATNLLAKVRGPGFPAEGYNVIGNTPVSAYAGAQDGTLLVPVSQRMIDFAQQQPEPFDLVGNYEFVVTCRAKLDPTSLGDMIGTLAFDADSRYTVTAPRVVVAPVQPGSTPAADPSGAAAGSAAPGASQAPDGAAGPEADLSIRGGVDAGLRGDDRGGSAASDPNWLRWSLLVGGLLLLLSAVGSRALPTLRRRRSPASDRHPPATGHRPRGRTAS